jgi:hypothetical protein
MQLKLVLSGEPVKEAVKFNVATTKTIAFVVGSQRSDLNHRTMLASRSSLAVGFECDPEWSFLSREKLQ